MKIRCPNRGRRSELRAQGSGARVQESACKAATIGRANLNANCKLQIANCKLNKITDSGQWAVGGGQGSGFRVQFSRESGLDGVQGSGFRVQGSALFTNHLPSTIYHLPTPRPSSLAPRPSRHGFTLIELLVTITIIGILTGMTLGAIRYARSAACESKTKATIAKLNDIVMRRYESYMTRRVPIDTSGTPPREAARHRYFALMDLMRMEMPERTYDILTDPMGSSISRPALSQMYKQKKDTTPPADLQYMSAKYLYMWVSMTHPEDMEQFSQNEIAVDPKDKNWPYFVDGWGMPIMFLRWAPGFSSGAGFYEGPNPVPNPFNPTDPTKTRSDASDIQTGNPLNDHDPFDTQRIFPGNYRLLPLIYSGGPDQAGHEIKYGITATAKNPDDTDYSTYYIINPTADPLDRPDPYASVPTDYGAVLIGSPSNPLSSDPGINRFDNIHNHRIEQQ